MRVGKPLTREESKIGDLITPGIYPFEVIDASDEVSKNGAEMIKLKIKVFLPDGRERTVFDYLLEALAYKMAHFFDCVGLWAKYESGDVSADDCFGRSGEVKIYTQKDTTGQYGDKSSVADYMLSDEQLAAKDARKAAPVNPETKKASFDDDDIPF